MGPSIRLPEFKTADIVEDYHILEEARRVAAEIVAAKDWQLDPRWAPILANLRVADQFD